MVVKRCSGVSRKDYKRNSKRRAKLWNKEKRKKIFIGLFFKTNGLDLGLYRRGRRQSQRCIRDRPNAKTGTSQGKTGDKPRQNQGQAKAKPGTSPVSSTHLRAHEPVIDTVCRPLLEKINSLHINARCPKIKDHNK